ncbi:E3 ubiquitin-protein ligase SIAH2 [Pteropus alecto]|nr:E3 ubiquitin-protein ligase SIAH2 [Pteropus alecto]
MNNQGYKWLTNARITYYQGLLCKNSQVHLETVRTLNPATFLPTKEGPPDHNCEEGTNKVYPSRPNLKEVFLRNPELVLFTDGNSFIHEGQRKAGYAITATDKYATMGCPLTLYHTEKPEHEDICEYCPYSCPCPGTSCEWQGSLEAVMSHLMHAHKSITNLQKEDIVFLATDINLPGAVNWVMMQSCFGHHFMLVLEKQEKYEGHQQLFAIVLLIGTCSKQAENFAYRLELNGNRRRLTWEATPRSIHNGVAAAIMNSDCLVFDTAIAHLFADIKNLGINMTISKCCP